MIKQEKLLVVGGTGFIGRNLVKTAISQGYVTHVVSLTIPHEQSKIDGASYYALNLSKSTEVKNFLQNRSFEYVINLGGYVDHSAYYSGGRKIFDVHFNGTKNLVDYLDKEVLKGFVQIGSSDEYGTQPAPQSEETRETPISAYSLGKVAAGQLLQMLYRTEKFPAVILRLFLVYGPGQDNNRFLPQIINACLMGESFKTSEGKQLRDFCYIDDIVNGVIKAMKTPRSFGEVINLASGEPLRIRQALERVVKIIGQGKPQFGKLAYRQGENMALYADITKAKELLSWEPLIHFHDGLNKTIKYYKAELVK